ncbi:MAG TPA: ABC transporter ATP-binding protein [Gemmatimonadaceae bacterium]|nr:ABC transporter ATP-binding protein [Gemmatimonadaceae bacterium]
MSGNAVLRLSGVERDFTMGADRVRAVRDVSLEIERGDYVAIVGPSGCGKSTLLNLLGAIDRPDAGQVFIDGRDASALGDREATKLRLTRIGFVFQRFHLLAALTARENVELPMAEAGMKAAERAKRARELLDYVGLSGRERHRPPQLSGGEQQRVAIARALANGPAIMLADEPTGELDARTGAGITALFARLNDDGTTLVVVTHDEELAGAARRVVHMRDGRVVRDERLRAPAGASASSPARDR